MSGTTSIQFIGANINWKRASEDVQQTLDDIQEFELSKDEIIISPNQDVSLHFEESGGDTFTGEKITIAIWKDNQRIELELNDSNEYRFPTNKGSYVLKINFVSSAGSAHYVRKTL